MSPARLPILFIISLVALALLVKRYYVTSETSNSDRNKLICVLAAIIGSSIATAVYWAVVEGNGWVGHVVTVSIWFLATPGLQLSVKQARKPKMWGVPLLPWLLSACIAATVFIMGSIDKPSFIRFILWTLVLLLYVFVPLHASYDAACETERTANASHSCFKHWG
ncbi:hypothetical protein Dsin_028229 [Dipteronia sinensis]|uniref:Cationic amino acid transporter C-terminal domain-containing protein n=1 Tax=Dipteronia sinensis TaxID=43782 RepID=A0AAD9ZPY9_9ROSI|nr:hypothetical protein Dsin_028229 [Dipteronia sinensis]